MAKGLKRGKVLLFSSLLIFTSLVAIPSSFAALNIGSVTGSPVSQTGGGGQANPLCPSNGILTGIGGQTYDYDSGSYKATLTQVTGTCGALASDGQSVASISGTLLGPYGSTGGTALTAANCSTANGTSVITGARVYKTAPTRFAGGVTLQCGTLPLGSNRQWGASLGSTSNTSDYEDISCATGSIAVGLNVYYGGIEDKFGIQCAQVLNIPQTISISSLGTSSKTYPYSQALSMTTSGNNGTGAITFAIAGGTATSCALSSSASSATITAASSGTCTITATIAADTNYVSATSAAVTFTFNTAGQASLTITSTSGIYGTALNLQTSGGSGTGTVTYTSTAGTTTCTVSGASLTAAATGTCSVTATKAGDVNYSSASSSATTINFAQGTSTVSISVPTGAIIYRTAKAITATTSVAGKVTFKANKAIIPGCKNILSNAGNSFTATCNYKSSVHGALTVTVTFSPNDPSYSGSGATTPLYYTSVRSTTR